MAVRRMRVWNNHVIRKRRNVGWDYITSSSSLKGCDFKPFQNDGLVWKENSCKYLGVHFSLNMESLYELNFIPKLNQIQQILNCWRSKNLSLIGKITVIKGVLHPILYKNSKISCFVLYLKIITSFWEITCSSYSKFSKELKNSIKIKADQAVFELLIQNQHFDCFDL